MGNPYLECFQTHKNSSVIRHRPIIAALHFSQAIPTIYNYVWSCVCQCFLEAKNLSGNKETLKIWERQCPLRYSYHCPPLPSNIHWLRGGQGYGPQQYNYCIFEQHLDRNLQIFEFYRWVSLCLSLQNHSYKINPFWIRNIGHLCYSCILAPHAKLL